MTAKLVSVHPLFDSSSIYNQMRGPRCAEGKMRGYIHWLWARAKHEPESHPAAMDRSAEELRRYARRLAGSDVAVPVNGQVEPRFGVLDVWTAPLTFIATDLPLMPDRWPHSEIDLCLVREPDGKQTLGCRARLPGLAWGAGGCCRAFLLEPEVVERLKGKMADRPWTDAFLAESVATNYEVAQILAAAPEMEGAVRGEDLLFERVPVPERYATLPPRKGPLQVVIVLNSTQGSG